MQTALLGNELLATVPPDAATPERMHSSMRKGLEQLATVALQAECQPWCADDRERSTDRDASDVFRDVLALACRMIVGEWLRVAGFTAGRAQLTELKGERPPTPTHAIEVGLEQCFPLEDNKLLAKHALFQTVPLPLQRVVQCAWSLADHSLPADEQPALVAWEWLLVAYEHALQLMPELKAGGLTLQPGEANRAHARRASGSYYTPMPLVESILNAALEPVVEETLARAAGDPEALLRLRLVDPACGTGRFLVSAAHRLTLRLMTARGDECDSKSPTYGQTYAEVVQHCVYGVDLNALAVGWCRLSLWVRTNDPHVDPVALSSGIRRGHALLNAPAGFERGIPEAAWSASADDDKATARLLRKRHRAAMDESERCEDQRVGLPVSPTRQRLLADIWCAAFFLPKRPGRWERLAATHDRWVRWNEGLEQPCDDTVKEARACAEKHSFFHWQLEYPEVFERGGFDLVLGNPPWIAHAGRAAQSLSFGTKLFYAANYRAFSGYRTTHALFVSLAARILRGGGRLGLVLPSSISELDGYRAARKEHDDLCDFPQELQDFGEGLFSGVTQPCMALISRRVNEGRRAAEHGSVWPLERPDLSEVAKALLSRLERLPRLPAELFGERGIQSDAAAREHFIQSREPQGRFSTPIREGSDVRAFQLAAARWHVDPVSLGSRLRPSEEYQGVSILVRQTARYPIAAVSDGVAFRNSLLAGYSNEEWSAEALVALLNSALVRWVHYARFRDARQPVLPQVKISHLRAIPAPVANDTSVKRSLAEFTRLLSEPCDTRRADTRLDLDAFVYDLYELGHEERALVDSWHHAHG